MTLRRVIRVGVALSATLIAACTQSARPTKTASVRAPADWRAVITRGDMERLHGWRDAFTAALTQAKTRGFGNAIAREGVLLQPDAALLDVGMPGGRYRCRVIKLGAKGEGNLSYIAYPPFDCFVADEGEIDSFFKLTGSQRPVGLIFNGDARRKIFVGTLMLGDEKTALEYGRDADRDMVGAFERVGDRRWRLVLPYPRFESLTDVVELVPAV